MTEEQKKYQHERQRKIFWCNAWASVAGSVTTPKPSIATTWADEALKEFDKRFPEPESKNVN